MGLSQCQFGTRHIRNCEIEREKEVSVSVRHFAAALASQRDVRDERVREKAGKRRMSEFISTISHMTGFYWDMQMHKWKPSIFPFIFLWPSWTRPWRDFIAGGQSVCCETWYPAPYSCETIWSIFRAQYGICLKPLYLKSLHALELMYSLFSYQLQHLPFWMAISVKRPEMRLKCWAV